MSGSGGNCTGCKIVGALVAIGAINWGLVGAFQKDLVASLLGQMTPAARAVYIIIGIAGLMKVVWLLGMCPCQKGGCDTKK